MQGFEKVNVGLDNDIEKYMLVAGKYFRHKSNNLGQIEGVDVLNMPFQVTRVGSVNGSPYPYVIPSTGSVLLWEEFLRVCEECPPPDGLIGDTIVRNPEMFEGLKEIGMLKGLPPEQPKEVSNKPIVDDVKVNVIEYKKSDDTIFDKFDSTKVNLEVTFPDLDMTLLMRQKSKDLDKFYSELLSYVKKNITVDDLKKIVG